MQRFKCIKEVLAGRIHSIKPVENPATDMMATARYAVEVVTSPDDQKPTYTATYYVHYNSGDNRFYLQMDHGFIKMSNEDLVVGNMLVFYLNKARQIDYVSTSPAATFAEGYIAYSNEPVMRGPSMG